MVPKNFNDDVIACLIKALAEMLEWLQTEQDFFNVIITGEENCFFKYDLKPRGRLRNGTHHNLQDRTGNVSSI
jgi:hypothetical protein